MLEGVSVTIRSARMFHRASCNGNLTIALARVAAPRPGTASRAEMHGQFAWHGIDPPTSRDPRHPQANSHHQLPAESM
jgi:hypothetical protein